MTENKDYTILVVDDSTTNVVLLEAILDEKGYQIETALNAKEAYNIIDKQTPDLILLDLLMPKISGFDFLEEIRKNEKNR
jgi:two-component system cell cycle response regulator DivK